MNILKNTELYTLSEWTVYYVNYISINLFKKGTSPQPLHHRMGGNKHSMFYILLGANTFYLELNELKIPSPTPAINQIHMPCLSGSAVPLLNEYLSCCDRH